MRTQKIGVLIVRVVTLAITIGVAAWLVVDTQHFANSSVGPARVFPHAPTADLDKSEPTTAEDQAHEAVAIEDADEIVQEESGLSDAPFFGPSTKSTIGIGGQTPLSFTHRAEARRAAGK